MNIGSLYTVKKFCWFLFPSKEKALPANGDPAALADDHASAASAASYWSKRFKCEVTYFSPDSIIIFLENDGKFKKVLTSDGKIGWTWFIESYNECFEEVKTK